MALAYSKLFIWYDGLEMDVDLRLDLLVNDCIVVELKAIENMLPMHKAQLISYMKLLKNHKDYSLISLLITL